MFEKLTAADSTLNSRLLGSDAKKWTLECWDSSQPLAWGDLSPTKTVVIHFRFPPHLAAHDALREDVSPQGTRVTPATSRPTPRR